MKYCKHQWYVFSTTRLQRSQMVECRKCSRCGFFEDPTRQEWKDACNAQSEPYPWKDNSRVDIWPGKGYSDL